MGIFGPPDITKLQSKKNVKRLIKALNYKKDAIIRIRAAKALGEMKCVEAVPEIKNTLTDKNGTVKKACIAALGEIGGMEAISVLNSIIDPKKVSLFGAVVIALKKINKPPV